jgi:hypothetical protein
MGFRIGYIECLDYIDGVLHLSITDLSRFLACGTWSSCPQTHIVGGDCRILIFLDVVGEQDR